MTFSLIYHEHLSIVINTFLGLPKYLVAWMCPNLSQLAFHGWALRLAVIDVVCAHCCYSYASPLPLGSFKDLSVHYSHT